MWQNENQCGNQSEPYVVLQKWMATELGLNGNDLIIYAVIYSFTQGEGGEFTGSLRYLAEWINIERKNVTRYLKKLVDRGLLIKEDIYLNGVKYCKYKAVRPTGCPQGEDTIPKIGDSIPKNDDSTTKIGCPQINDSTTKIGDSIPKIGVPKNKTVCPNLGTNNKEIDIYTNNKTNNKLNNIFNNKEKKHKNTITQDLEKIVNEYTDNEELRQALLEFIQMRKDLKSPVKTINGFKRLLGTLNKLATKVEDKIKIVNQTLDHEWKSFYELKTNQLPYKNKNMNNGYLVGNYKPTERTLKEMHRRDNEKEEWSDEVF